MKTNQLVFDILRGPWLVHEPFIEKYSQLANNYFSGNFKGTAIDRKEFFAAAGKDYSAISHGQQEPQKKIVKVPMRGLLPAHGDMCILGADDYLEYFRMLNENDTVSAVVLDIEGPGSSVSAINYMKEFAEEKKKPFVGLVNSCFSGHYWLSALLCDHIMAYGNISSEVGSIGVLSIVIDNRKEMEKDGWAVKIIRSRHSSTKAQQMVDFYEGNDKEFIESMQDDMDPMAESFISDVKKLRPKLNLDLEGLFTGSTFKADKALKDGLIDSIGNEKKAFERAQMLVELDLYN